ncbi:hypothetical protein ACWDBO_45065 [Streptomyces mirabilis]|uniref:hypothetical protein n=1 Tax=Streptomyces mirabilis TaxID=68239 RepID=UPI00332B17A9
MQHPAGFPAPAVTICPHHADAADPPGNPAANHLARGDDSCLHDQSAARPASCIPAGPGACSSAKARRQRPAHVQILIPPADPAPSAAK